MRRLTAYASGKVQKTGYRARVLTIARDFGLKDYVQNLDDGRVKVVSGGETDQRLDVAAALLTKLIVVNEKILDEIKATRQELTETHEDLNESINESRDAVVSEIRELRTDLKENLESRLIRIESDVSQIKAKIAL